MLKFLKYCSLSTLILLTACANFNVAQQNDFAKRTIIKRQQAGRHLHSWYVSGAFSITQNNKQTIASYKWWQRAKQSYTLQIFGPLSLGLVTVRSTPGSVALQQGKKTTTATSASDLLKQQLGWDFPVQNLFYWARGLKVPGASYQQGFDKFGHLISVRQGSWQIKFSAYKTFAGNIDLPQRLLLSASGVRIKLVLKNWQFAS